MEGRAASIVYLVYIHVLQFHEIVKWGRLIALCRDMKNIGTVHIFGREVGMHFFYQDFYQLVVTMVSSEVKRCKFFVSRLICP